MYVSIKIWQKETFDDVFQLKIIKIRQLELEKLNKLEFNVSPHS